MNYKQLTNFLKSIGHEEQDCYGDHVYAVTLLDKETITQECIYCGIKQTMSHKAFKDTVKTNIILDNGREVSLYE